MKYLALGQATNGGPARMVVVEIDDGADLPRMLWAIGQMNEFDMSFGLALLPCAAAVGGPLGNGPA